MRTRNRGPDRAGTGRPASSLPEVEPAALFGAAGVFFLVGAVLVALGTALYVSTLPRAERGSWNVVYVYAGIGAAVGLTLYIARDKLPGRLAVGLPFAAIMLLGIPMLAGRTVTPTGAILLIWPVLYAAALLPETIALATTATSVTVLIVAIILDPSTSLGRYGPVAATLVVTGYVTISLQRRIRALIAQVAEQAATDPLTGLPNRRVLQEMLKREAAAHQRRRSPLSLWMIDIDRFKMLNDTAGHAAGDDALRRLAALLADLVRAGDLAARYGGEEFSALLLDCPLSEATVRAEQLRSQIEAASLSWPHPITVSIGVAELDLDTADVSDLIHRADSAMYQAKNSGRNRVRSTP